MKGQIISPKKQSSRGAFIKNRDKEKDREKSSLYSAASSNSSKMYMQGENTSSRSIISAEYDGSHRPLPLRNPLYGRNGSTRLSPDDASEAGSISGPGHQRGTHGIHHHHHWHHHADHHLPGGFEFGLDDEQTDIDIINAIFTKPPTPPSSPQVWPSMDARPAYLAKDINQSHSNALHDVPLHSDSNYSEASDNSRHHSPAQALAFLHRSKDRTGKTKQNSAAYLGVEDSKGRKRVASAPSKSLFPPLRSGSRASQPVSIVADDTAEGSMDSREGHHSHHSHHHDSLGPVVVHIPTRQEPIDVHSHPFRRKGKATAAMHGTTSVSHSIHFSNGENNAMFPPAEHDIHRRAPADVAELEASHLDGVGGGSGETKRRAATSAAAHIFKMPFKNRSSSALSSTASLQSAAPILEAGPFHRATSEADHKIHEQASKVASDIPRGSIDLQKTIRPSSEGDPTRTTLRRMTSPDTMTAAEEADLQKYIAEQSQGTSQALPLVERRQDAKGSLDSPRSSYSLARVAVDQQLSGMQTQSDPKVGASQNSSTPSLSEEGESENGIEESDLERQITNEEALDERTRRLRDRGLLPTLSITTSDELPASFPHLPTVVNSST